MKNKVKCKVVRLGCIENIKKCPVAQLHLNNNRLSAFPTTALCETKFYHLYILAPQNDKIQVGDWSIVMGQVMQVNKCTYITEKYEKIIATTDPYLNLPRLSDEFIKEYCILGDIDTVTVEYEDYCPLAVCHDFNDDGCEKCCSKSQRPKVTFDNTIIISKQKDSWTKAEIIDLIGKFNYDKSKDNSINIGTWIYNNL